VQNCSDDMAVLRGDNTELRTQCNQLNDQMKDIRRQYETLDATHTELLADHEHLQSLHERLSLDYEALKEQTANVKSDCKVFVTSNEQLLKNALYFQFQLSTNIAQHNIEISKLRASLTEATQWRDKYEHLQQRYGDVYEECKNVKEEIR
jgi:chromosome segregation ATPase